MVSENFFQGTMNKPLDGTGQGSGASTTIWLAVSLIIIDALKEKNTGLQFKDPQQKIKIRRICDYYFDDAACGINWTEKIPLKEITRQTESFIQEFEELLYTSGGEISLIKSFWYMISCK